MEVGKVVAACLFFSCVLGWQVQYNSSLSSVRSGWRLERKIRWGCGCATVSWQKDSTYGWMTVTSLPNLNESIASQLRIPLRIKNSQPCGLNRRPTSWEEDNDNPLLLPCFGFCFTPQSSIPITTIGWASKSFLQRDSNLFGCIQLTVWWLPPPATSRSEQQARGRTAK